MDSSQHSRRDMDSSRHSRKGEAEFDSSSLLNLIEKAAENEAARKALRLRKKYELKLIRKFDKWRLSSKECWFLVDTQWLNAWSTFVKGADDEDPPGLITSKDLLDDKGNPVPGLKAKLDYRGVSPIAFYVLVQLHGRDKTPPICRYAVDIYKPAIPEDRLINMKLTAVMEAKIAVNKVRPKWMSWDLEFDDDDEDDGLGWCCGLTKEHIEAFIYWAIMCWANRGRKKSGREGINYRQYKPLRGLDDDPDFDPEAQGGGRGSQHGAQGGGAGGGSRHGSVSSSHGSAKQGANEDGKGGEVTVNMLHAKAGAGGGAGAGAGFAGVSVSKDALAKQKIELVGMETSDLDSEYESTDDEGFEVGPADVNHERGTWLNAFSRR